MKINVFDVDQLSRRVLDRTWRILAAKSAQHDPKMAPQDDPKSIKNRDQKMLKILIDKKSFRMIHLARPGGLRGSRGEYKGGENTPKMTENLYLATSSSTSGFKGPMKTKK